MKKIITLALILLGFVNANAQYTTTNVVTGLEQPVAFTIAPDGRFFVTLKAGQIVVYNPNGTLIGTFYNLADSTFNNFERGLLGIELDPDYATNRYVYAYYNHRWPNTNAQNANQRCRVVRFTDVNNVGTNPTIIINLSPGSINGNHVGGNIRFRPSEPNMLYLTMGEIAIPANAQLLTNPWGKMLRINKNGTIPTDNPFYDDGNPATGNDDRIWAYGLRNSFDFCFSPVNDSLYASENGQNTWDEVNQVMKGRNYGWNTCEGRFTNGSTTNPCTIANSVLPIEVWGANLPSVTGVIHYSGCLMPALTNHLLVADNDNGRLWDIELGNAPAYNTFISRTQLLDLDGLTTLKEGADGAIYAMNGGYTSTGKIYRIAPTTPPTAPLATFSTSANQAFCAGSDVVITAQTDPSIVDYTFDVTVGGTPYSSQSGAQSSINLGVIFPGNPIEVSLTVSNGCQTDTATFTTQVSATPQFSLSALPDTNNTGVGTITIAITDPFDGDIFISPAPVSVDGNVYTVNAGVYTISLTDTITSCTSIESGVVVENVLVSVNEFAAAGFSLYPNPAGQQLNVKLGNQSLNGTLRIFNSQGALVQQQPLVNADQAAVNTANLPAGLYSLSLQTAKDIYSTRWVRE